MTYRGTVKNGVVVLEDPKALPEGSTVSVRALKGRKHAGKPHRPKSLYERLKPFIGIAEDLPSDFSINHDHYLYGAPKRK